MKERIELDNGFLTSKPLNAPHPRNKPYEFYLFVTKIRTDGRGREHRKRDIVTLSGKRRRDVVAQLAAFARQRNVKIVESQ